MTGATDTECEGTRASNRRPVAGGSMAGLCDGFSPRMAELRSVWQEYLAMKIATLRLSVWKAVATAASVVLAIVFAAAMVVTATVFAFLGLAGWFGEVTSRPYLGSLLAGLCGLLVVGGTVLAVRMSLAKKAMAAECEDHGD